MSVLEGVSPSDLDEADEVSIVVCLCDMEKVLEIGDPPFPHCYPLEQG